jgi:outer membrane protein assembly factor BamB
MNEVRLERLLTELLADTAPTREPDRLVPETLRAARRVRRRRQWLALLKEPPMRLNHRVAVGSPILRMASMAALTAALVLALAAAVVAGASLLPDPGPGAPGDDWAMIRSDAAHRATALTGPTGNPVVTWTYQTQGIVNDPIAVVGDLVFVGSDDGVLQALDRATGTVQWAVTFDEPGTTNPAVVDGVVYVRDGGGRFHALDAATGAERWLGATTYESPTQPTVADGRILFGTGTGDVVALDTATGDELWNDRVSPYGLAARSPAIVDGTVFLTADGAGVRAMDAATGADRWQVDAGSAPLGTVVVADGIAYAGAVLDAEPNHLQAFDARTGSRLWERDEPLFSPAVSGGVAYSGSAAGIVTARNARTGAELWRAQLPSVARLVSVAGTTLYVSTDEAGVFALDATTGSQVWQQPTEGHIYCGCFAVARGSVFAGTDQGIVAAIGGEQAP